MHIDTVCKVKLFTNNSGIKGTHLQNTHLLSTQKGATSIKMRKISAIANH